MTAPTPLDFSPKMPDAAGLWIGKTNTKKSFDMFFVNIRNSQAGLVDVSGFPASDLNKNALWSGPYSIRLPDPHREQAERIAARLRDWGWLKDSCKDYPELTDIIRSVLAGEKQA